MTRIFSPVVLISTFLWIGFVCAISFMEAWLKFRAPGITLPLGLGIGRIVFRALNKVELVFSLSIFLNLFINKRMLVFKNLGFYVALCILLLQTFWMLPALDFRAQLYIDNAIVPPSNLHFYYVFSEIIKVIMLFIFGINLFEISKK